MLDNNTNQNKANHCNSLGSEYRKSDGVNTESSINQNHQIYNTWNKPAPLKMWLAENTNLETIKWRKHFQFYLKSYFPLNEYQLSPIQIPFIDKLGKKQIYQPLCLLYQSAETGASKNILADIRSDSDIAENKEWFLPAWKESRRWASVNGLEFKIYRDKFFNSVFFRNIKFTSKYVNFTLPPENDWLILENVIYKKKAITVKELLDSVAINKIHRKRLRDYIWIFVTKGIFQANWNRKFNNNSKIWMEN